MSKKSFVLHTDSLEVLDQLTDEQAGKLFKAIAAYQASGEIVALDQLLNIVIKPFLNQFERDSKKWNEKKERDSYKGRFGNLKRWHEDLYKKVIKDELSLEKAESIAKDRHGDNWRSELSPSDNQRQKTSPKSLVSASVSASVSGRDIYQPNQKPLNKKTPNYNTRSSVEEKNARNQGEFKKIGDLVGDLVGEDEEKKSLEAIDILAQFQEFELQKISPGWDKEFLAKKYVEGINGGKREAPNNIKKAFPAWCKKYTGGKRL